MENLKTLYSNIYALVQELILNPRAFWKSHINTSESRDELFKSLLLPLLAIVCAAVFLGEFFRSDYFRIWMAALWVIREIALFASLYFVGVYGTNEMIKYFGYEPKIEAMQKLVSYSMVPLMLISAITGLFPFFKLLDIFGIYGFYIFLMGGRKLLPFPREKRDNLILKIVAANWIVFGLISFTLAKLLMTLDQ
jgi:glucan phosphoethanolaminetransferase (alkaline phosphatase superfamily)